MKKQDLAKLAILGMLGVAATVGAQQQQQQGSKDTTNYDGSKGICTDQVSNYSSSDPSQAGKKPAQGQPPAQPTQSSKQSEQTSSKTWGGSNQSGLAQCGNLAGCKTCGGLTGCKSGDTSKCSGLANCKGSDTDCGPGGCASGDYSGSNSTKMQSKRQLRQFNLNFTNFKR